MTEDTSLVYLSFHPIIAKAYTAALQDKELKYVAYQYYRYEELSRELTVSDRVRWLVRLLLFKDIRGHSSEIFDLIEPKILRENYYSAVEGHKIIKGDRLE